MSKKTFITVLITVATFSFVCAQEMPKNDSIEVVEDQVTNSSFNKFNGNWLGIIAGSVEFYYEFKVKDNVLTGITDSEGSITPILNGVVSGDTISFVMIARDEKIPTVGILNGDDLVINFTYSGMDLSGNFKKLDK